jgi:hypothetical protein
MNRKGRNGKHLEYNSSLRESRIERGDPPLVTLNMSKRGKLNHRLSFDRLRMTM